MEGEVEGFGVLGKGKGFVLGFWTLDVGVGGDMRFGFSGFWQRLLLAI